MEKRKKKKMLKTNTGSIQSLAQQQKVLTSLGATNSNGPSSATANANGNANVNGNIDMNGNTSVSSINIASALPITTALKPISSNGSGRFTSSMAYSQNHTNLHPVLMSTGSLKDLRAMAGSGFSGSMRADDTGSEYAESEYADTIVSDAVTDLESLNSISDEEIEASDDHRNKMQHLQLPDNEYE